MLVRSGRTGGRMATANRIKDYLGKARDTVSRLSREIATDTDTTVEAGDFRLNVTERKARVRDKELELTSLEFDLLLFLMQHPRRLVTPRTRLATNWGSLAVRQTEFLQTLFSLRRKLESVEAARSYIRTEPWVFYLFDPTASAHELTPRQHAPLAMASRE